MSLIVEKEFKLMFDSRNKLCRNYGSSYPSTPLTCPPACQEEDEVTLVGVKSSYYLISIILRGYCKWQVRSAVRLPGF